MNQAALNTARSIPVAQSNRRQGAVVFVQIGIVCLFLVYSLRYLPFTFLFTNWMDLGFYTNLTTILAIGLAVLLFTMSSNAILRFNRVDTLFILLGGGFLTLTVYQGSLEGAVLAGQIFILPILMRWIKHVPRSSMKTALVLLAIASSLFMIGEFIALNEEWLKSLRLPGGIVKLYGDFHSTIIPSNAGLVQGEIQRPHGILGYILTSGVSLGMLSAFFFTESFVYRRFGDYVVALLLISALVLSTSTTGIYAFSVAIAVLFLFAKLTGSKFGTAVNLRSLLFIGALALLVGFVLWPVLDGLWSRFGLATGSEAYRASFAPEFRAVDDVVRFFFGGNWGEISIGFNSEGWAFQGNTMLVRESNLFNLIALFGVLPMLIVFWRWLLPIGRLWDRNYSMKPDGFPFLAALLTGIFTIVHDNGIVHWNNIFLFYAYYEYSRIYQVRTPNGGTYTPTHSIGSEGSGK